MNARTQNPLETACSAEDWLAARRSAGVKTNKKLGVSAGLIEKE
jgi:hypothetical protein